jgi:hypothetical protein
MAAWKMEQLKGFMFKIIFFVLIFTINLTFAKDVALTVVGNPSEVTAEIKEEQILTLNGYRQAVTGELEDLKLDSEIFWNKLDQKKLSSKDEALFLQSLFDKTTLEMTSPKETAPVVGAKLTANFKSSLDLEKLKMMFLEVTTDLAETKLKTFYIQAFIDLEANMTWDDVGVVKAESFKGVILDSWKKLIEKEVPGFEKINILEKDLSTKPDYMNSKSIILKWTSTFKKTAMNTANQTASYELSAHYVLQNAKSGSSLLAFDFPIQKRDLDVHNKKALSSTLASLVYNLLLSQVAKINSTLEVTNKAQETSEIEIKFVSKASLTEISQINSLLQEKFKDLKLTSQMKSYESSGSTLLIRAEASLDKILDALSAKTPLNEQNVLLFNRADKTFAILPKESNN